jgi:integrase
MGVLVRKKKETGDIFVIARAFNKRCSKKVPDAKTGLQLARQWRRELALGTFIWPDKKRVVGSVTFGEVSKAFIEASKLRLKPNTWLGYQSINNLHLRGWWKLPVQSITKAQITKLLLDKQEAGLTTHNIYTTISAIFAYAVEQDLLETNPAHRLGKRIRAASVPRKIAHALSKEERDRFLKEAEDSPYYVFFLTLFKTGMRLGEARALALEDVDWNANQIHVCRSVSHTFWTTPKTGRDRYVVMSPHLAEALRKYGLAKRKFCPQYKAEKIRLVFSEKHGNPIDPIPLREDFWANLKLAGLPRIRLHDCRHSFASQLLSAGASLFFTQKQLGHANVQTTVGTYGHLLPEGKEQIKIID